MAIVGVVLIVLGIAFLFLGFAGAVREMFKKAVTRGGLAEFTKLIDAVTALIKALTAAPLWLACVAIGVILVGAGAYLLGVR